MPGLGLGSIRFSYQGANRSCFRLVDWRASWSLHVLFDYIVLLEILFHTALRGVWISEWVAIISMGKLFPCVCPTAPDVFFIRKRALCMLQGARNAPKINSLAGSGNME
jgi:hypothetical protein